MGEANLRADEVSKRRNEEKLGRRAEFLVFFEALRDLRPEERLRRLVDGALLDQRVSRIDERTKLRNSNLS